MIPHCNVILSFVLVGFMANVSLGQDVDAALDVLSPMPPLVDGNASPQAMAAYDRGTELLAGGDASAALLQLNQAVVADPNFAAAYLARAQALAELGQSRSAVKSLSTGLSAASDVATRAAIHLERGDLYLASGQFAKALDDFDRAFELQPASADVAHRRGKALRQLAAEELALGTPGASERMQQALAAFDRAIAIQPDHAEALSDRASLHADLGQRDKAVEDLTKALSVEPDDRDRQYRLAVLHLQQATADSSRDFDDEAKQIEELRTAGRLLTAALQHETEPDDEEELQQHQIQLARAVALVELAAVTPDSELRNEQYQAALIDCTEVTTAKPELPAAHFQRGIVLRLMNDFRPAIDAFSRTLRLSPENTEAHIRRGICWFHLGEFELALSDFHAVGVLPGDARPYFWTGVIHARRGDHLEAIRAYSEAIDENSRYRLAYHNRALSLMHLGHWQRAIDDCNAMIQLDPDDADAYRHRALAQQHLGRIEEAQRSFANAVELGG